MSSLRRLSRWSIDSDASDVSRPSVVRRLSVQMQIQGNNLLEGILRKWFIQISRCFKSSP